MAALALPFNSRALRRNSTVPYTPFSPGEPVSPRDDEPRWFEPVAPDAIIEPTAPDEEWSAVSESAAPRATRLPGATSAGSNSAMP